MASKSADLEAAVVAAAREHHLADIRYIQQRNLVKAMERSGEVKADAVVLAEELFNLYINSVNRLRRAVGALERGAAQTCGDCKRFAKGVCHMNLPMWGIASDMEGVTSDTDASECHTFISREGDTKITEK